MTWNRDGCISLWIEALRVTLPRSSTRTTRSSWLRGFSRRESVKEYFAAFRNHLEKDHGLVVKREDSSHGIVLTDMSAKEELLPGLGARLLLAGEAGGFLRGGEGITSSLISGKAAGEAVVESAKSGKPAIDHFRDLAV